MMRHTSTSSLVDAHIKDAISQWDVPPHLYGLGIETRVVKAEYSDEFDTILLGILPPGGGVGTPIAPKKPPIVPGMSMPFDVLLENHQSGINIYSAIEHRVLPLHVNDYLATMWDERASFREVFTEARLCRDDDPVISKEDTVIWGICGQYAIFTFRRESYPRSKDSL